MSLADIKQELMRAEYPQLRPDHDPDVERYFTLRSFGRNAESLQLYHALLRPRYPDDVHRAAILRAFRMRSPEYLRLMEAEYAKLGDRLLERIKRSLKYIAHYAKSFNPKDAYSTIKAAEAILNLLPDERFEAIATIERFRIYAERLDYAVKPLSIAEDLVRSYLTESLEVVQEERRRRQEEVYRQRERERQGLVARDLAAVSQSPWLNEGISTARKDSKRRADSGEVSAMFDLSRLRFSAADLARIQIPPTLTKIEDKTLAFCFKYWNLAYNDAFERTLFLYSRKYNTKHYEVFVAIRLGRQAQRRDEEILNSVSQILITGYYYSIRGDVYMQQAWKILRARLDGALVKKSMSLEEDIKADSDSPSREKVRARRARAVAKKSPAAPARKAAAKKKPAAPVKKSPPARAKTAAAARKAAASKKKPPDSATKTTIDRPMDGMAGAVKETGRKKNPRAAAKSAPGSTPVASLAKGVPGTTVEEKPELAVSTLASPPDAIDSFEQNVDIKRTRHIASPGRRRLKTSKAEEEQRAPGSVSDRLKALSGRSYDVFRDRFLAKLRQSIRTVLVRHTRKNRFFFASLPQELEDLVYRFFEEHYDDPFMDWAHSEACKTLEQKGWPLESIDGIIEDCYRRL